MWVRVQYGARVWWVDEAADVLKQPCSLLRAVTGNALVRYLLPPTARSDLFIDLLFTYIASYTSDVCTIPTQ